MNTPVALQDIPVRNTVAGHFGRFVHGERSTLAFWEITADSISPMHQHPHEQITYIVSGTFEMELDGIRHLLHPGDTLVIPPNTVHGGKAITDVQIIDSFCPVREDYLYK
ncbi:cupin domain-containing protein [Chitinophaga solisilvae]|uniref:Cupin domain-containing protein n=1 Tax=Chitinophaga solisilvae TaxID=1233460 RepID=A0A3S1AWZ8_9BACT|nr:cupin domain-containing protein [Chitinophaga solisilvae]NSL89646.1 cupin domain-containing protein [Chitinophaga solisilvae]